MLMMTEVLLGLRPAPRKMGVGRVVRCMGPDLGNGYEERYEEMREQVRRRQDRIVKLVERRGIVTLVDVANEMKISRATATQDAKELLEQRRLKRYVVKRGGRSWHTYGVGDERDERSEAEARVGMLGVSREMGRGQGRDGEDDETVECGEGCEV